MVSTLLAAVAGCVFALGLVVADMTSAARVVGFLDLRRWDPTLGFVMAGAIAVYAVAARLGPPLATPPPTAIDRRLLAGAALFGIGWGLAGYCPGPALVSLGAGHAAVFVAAMAAGMLATRRSSSGRRPAAPAG